MPEITLSRQLELARSARNKAIEECLNEFGPWGIQGSGYEEYDRRLSCVLPSEEITSLITENFSTNDPIVVAELAGQGNLLVELKDLLPDHIKGGIYSSLGDYEGLHESTQFSSRNIHGVHRRSNVKHSTGNFVSNKFWRDFAAVREEIAPEGIGVVFATLIYGWSFIPNTPEVNYYIANNVFQNVKEGGFIFADTPIAPDRFSEWIDLVNASGVATVTTSQYDVINMLAIHKLQDAPLPGVY